MASGHGADRLSACRDLGYYPGLVFITPCPPSPGAGEHFQPTDRLGDNTMFSVHSKPNGLKSGRRIADQDIIRKVGAEHRLRSTRTWTRTNPVLAMLPSGEYTLTTRDNIASQTGECGEAREVLRLFQALLPDQTRVLGADHPDTRMTRNNIAAWTGECGDTHEALRLFEALLPDQTRVLGADHPDTRRTLSRFRNFQQ